MQELKKQIIELQAKIKDNEGTIKDHFASLGELITRQEGFEETSIGELYKEIRNLLKIEPSKRKQIVSINNIEEKLAAVREELKASKQAILEKEKEVGEHYLKVGETAFRLYKSDSSAFEAYKNFFLELESLEDKLGKAGKDLSAANRSIEAKQNFFTQILSVTKTLYIEKKQDILMNRQVTLLKNAGKKVLDSHFPTNNADMSHVVGPFEKLQQEIDSNRKEISKLEAKETELKGNSAELGVKVGSQWKIKELEKEIEQTRGQILEKNYLLGKKYLEKSKDISVTLSGSEPIIEDIRVLESENSSHKEMIAKFNAKIEVIKLHEKIAKNKLAIKALEEKIEKEKSEIKGLNKNNSNFEKEIEKLTNDFNLE